MTDESGGVNAPGGTFGGRPAVSGGSIQLESNVHYLFLVRNMFFFDFGTCSSLTPSGSA
jgi:hypothetical protein